MNFTKHILVAGPLALSFVIACSSEGPVALEARSGSPAALLPAAPAADDSWATWVADENQRIASERPDFYAAMMDLQAKRTRAGFPRLVDPSLHDPDAAPIFIHRLLDGDEDPGTRAALAEALPRTQGSFSAAASAMIGDEADPQVQAVLVETMKRADPPHALAGLRAGLADADLEVRVAAARTAGSRADGAELIAELLAALAEGEDELRGAAAHSLGLLDVEAAKVPLEALLTHESSDLRLHALRALWRIDVAHLRSLPIVDDLQSDADPRVARAAAKLLASH